MWPRRQGHCVFALSLYAKQAHYGAHPAPVAESLEALINYLLPGLDWIPVEAGVGLMHVADAIQCLRFIREAHTDRKGKK